MMRRGMDGALLQQFLAAPRQTGTIAPSSRWLARALADAAFAEDPRVVVEVGAGTGAVTKELAKRAAATGADFVAVELDGKLARKVEGGRTVQAHAAWLPVRRADVVVSGIPFASLRRHHAEDILAECARTAPRLVLFQYSTRRFDLITGHFPALRAVRRVRWNLPPAFVLEARV